MQELAGALSGQYDFVREVGRGGMGIVCLAHDRKLQRDVAIKTLPPHLADNAEIRERFLREARTAAGLSHPNIVPIYHADEVGGRVFFVMGYVDGQSLAQLLRDHGPLSARRAAEILIDVAVALAYAHERGVVHRDVKAENILIDGHSGRAMVTDFGIARLAEAKPLTQTGSVLGTVYYMSPEQVSGDVVDGRSDLYALGVVGFLALSGHFPFESDTPSAVLVAHVTKKAPPLRSLAPHIPVTFAQIIDRCLAKDPAGRFANGDELASALDGIINGLSAELPTPTAPRDALLMSSTEAQAVWQRAAELQSSTGAVARPTSLDFSDRQRPVSTTSAYSLADVEAGAAGVGVGPQYVSRALAELGLTNQGERASATGLVRPGITSPKNHFLGASSAIAFEAIVDGEMPERDFDLMVDLIRRAIGDAGMVSAVGRSLTWSSADRRRKVSISILVRAGKTSIYVGERLRDLAGGLFGGIMGGGGGGTIGPAIGIGMNYFHSGAAALLIAVGWMGTMYGIARTIFSRMSRSRGKALQQLTEALAEQARESIHSTTLPTTGDLRRLRR
jgi:serine/threonine-protein kinase